jgi:NitT/TauT family transport system permease protein
LGDKSRANARSNLRASGGRLAFYHALLLGGMFLFWYVMTEPGLIPPFYFDDPTRAKFFFGQPLEVAKRIWTWFAGGSIYLHLGVTLIETLLAFAIGTALGLVLGLWLALSPTASTLADPYIKAMNAMPRVILAPIFAVWFGLGITSKVVFGITLVFFIVFFNVYQGVKEVSPVVLANARMLGASGRQLLRYIYLPSATSWVFSSLHTSIGLAFVGAVDRQLLRSVYIPSATSWVFASVHNSVGLAFVGAVVGEYLGSARGVGYLIHQAEGVFDIDTVFAGILVLTIFALILDFIVTRIESRLLAWRPRAAETERL